MPRFAQAAAPERLGLRRLAPPTSLAALLAIVVSVGLAWALLVPPWQSPDEIAHFAYAQSLAESFTIPGSPQRPGSSSDETFADGSVGASRGAFFPRFSPPDWTRSDYASYLAAEHGAAHPPKGNGGGVSTAAQNPPLYYLFADLGYLIDQGGTAFGRLYAMRLSGVLLLAVTTLCAWLLAGEVFARRRLAQLTCAAVSGLLPMTTFMSTNVNPDALLITTWTLVLWLGARVINHRARDRDVLALCAATAAAILTKSTSYALVMPVAFALFIGWRRRPAPERRRALWRISAASLALVVPVLGWLALARASGQPGINSVGSSPGHPFSIRGLLRYLWQFYLPRPPFMARFRLTPRLSAYDIWLRQGTGVFGWLDVYLPNWIYRAAGWPAAAIGIVVVGLLARLRGRRELALLGFLGLALLALLGLLHIVEYRMFLAGQGQFLQGRYLLPIVSLAGLAVGLVVTSIPRSARPGACALAIIGLLAVQVISLATIVQAYYL